MNQNLVFDALFIDPHQKTVVPFELEIVSMRQADEAIEAKLGGNVVAGDRLTRRGFPAHSNPSCRHVLLFNAYTTRHGKARFRLSNKTFVGQAVVVAYNEFGRLADMGGLTESMFLERIVWVEPAPKHTKPSARSARQVDARKKLGRVNSLKARSTVKKLVLKYARKIDRISPFDRTGIAVHAMLSAAHSDIDVTPENVRQHLRDLEAKGLLQKKPKKQRKLRSAYKR